MPIEVHALEPQIRLILCSPGTDLTTISAKRVRKQLLDVEPSLTAKYLKENRKELDTVIARVFEAVANGQGIEDSGQGEEQTSPSKKHRKRKSREDGVSADGGVAGDDDDRYEEDEDEEDESGSQARTSSPKKLKKGVKGRGTVLSDAELARRLSSEINSRSSRRSAGRPAGSNGSTPRKGGKKKSAAVVDSDDGDDSEGYASGKKQAKVKRKAGGAAKGGFAKEYTLSAPLAAVVAAETLSRPQVVKHLWDYIKGNGLQNPNNKREIVCDAGLRAVFNVDKIDMFRMNKVLGQHLHEHDG